MMFSKLILDGQQFNHYLMKMPILNKKFNQLKERFNNFIIAIVNKHKIYCISWKISNKLKEILVWIFLQIKKILKYTKVPYRLQNKINWIRLTKINSLMKEKNHLVFIRTIG